MNGRKARDLRKVVKEAHGHFNTNSTEYQIRTDKGNEGQIIIKPHTSRWFYKQMKKVVKHG